jgi:hypothetical protein
LRYALPSVGKETIIGARSIMEVRNEVIAALNANQITIQVAKRIRPAMSIVARERKSRTATAPWVPLCDFGADKSLVLDTFWHHHNSKRAKA